MAVLTGSFWNKTGTKKGRAPGQKKGQTREALTHRVPWTVAIFLLGYVGAEGMTGRSILRCILWLCVESLASSAVQTPADDFE